MVFGAIISWKSKKQATVALSTCEAELMALAMAMQEALWLKGVLEELKILTPGTPVKIHEDNKGTKSLVEDAKFSDRTKHIDIKYLRIREEIARGFIKVVYCHTSKMIADILTKPLKNKAYEHARGLLNMFFVSTIQPPRSGCYLFCTLRLSDPFEL